MATFVEDIIGDLHPLGCLSRLRPAPLRLQDLPQNHELHRRWPTYTGRIGTGIWIMPPAAGPNSDTKGALLAIVGQPEISLYYGVLSGLSPLSGVFLQGHAYHQMWASMSPDARADCSPLFAWSCMRAGVPDGEHLIDTMAAKWAPHGLPWLDEAPASVGTVQEVRRGIDI